MQYAKVSSYPKLSGLVESDVTRVVVNTFSLTAQELTLSFDQLPLRQSEQTLSSSMPKTKTYLESSPLTPR